MKHRFRLFGLLPFVGSKLFLRTLQSEHVELTDKRILKAAEGADVFLDTAVRFMEGDENAVKEQRVFSQNLFRLLDAKARTVTGLHHAPKNFADQTFLSLENCLRGSSELGAMLSAAWGVRKVSDDPQRTTLYIQNIKARDFEPCSALVLEGRPHIDKDGDFRMVREPGMAGDVRDYLGKSKAGRPSTVEGKREGMREMLKQGLKYGEIAKALDCSWDAVKRFARAEGLNALNRRLGEKAKPSEA